MDSHFEDQAELLYRKSNKLIQTFSKASQQAQNFTITMPEDFQTEFFSLIDKVTLSLLEDENNFYGYFLFQMSREIRYDISSPTAVNFKHASYIIYFNPLLFLTLTTDQRQSTIKHEILHILSLHLIRAKGLKNSYSKAAINMAMDIVVNEYLEHLPPYATTLEEVNKKYSLKLKPYKSFEYYAEELHAVIGWPKEEKNAPEEEHRKEETRTDDSSHMKEAARTDGSSRTKEAVRTDDISHTDDSSHRETEENRENRIIASEYDVSRTHDLWEESDEIDERTQREFTAKIIQLSEKGEIPSHVKALIASLEAGEGELPWNLYLKRLMGTVESNRKKTITRRNRRQPDRPDLRGELRSHKANIAVAIDISGSISEEEFKQALKEVLNIVKNNNHQITVLECDDEIRRVYTVSSSKDIKDRIRRKGYTKFSPVFEYANQNKINLLVYFTDGKGEDRLSVIPRGYQVLWVISGKGEALSLKKPYGIVKKLNRVEIKEDGPDVSDVIIRSGFSMMNQEK